MTRIEQKTKKNRLIKFNRDVQEKNRFLYEMLGQPAPEQYIFLSPAYRETLLAGIHQQAAQGIQGKVQAADQGILHTYLPQDFRALCLRADGTLGRGPDPAQPDIPPFQPGNHPALHRAGAGGHRQSVRFHTSMRIFSTMPGTRAGVPGYALYNISKSEL